MGYTDLDKEQIYKQYKPKVFGYIVSRTNDINTAEDICADVFLKIYDKLDSFDSTKASISTWIYTITHNTVVNYYRGIHETTEYEQELPDINNQTEEQFINKENLELLAKALEQLEERERDVIIFHYYSRLTLKEIGLKMGYSYSYMKILHNKALDNLKQKLLKMGF